MYIFILKIISVEIQQEATLGSKLNILIETYSHLKWKSKMQFYPINFFVSKPSYFYFSLWSVNDDVAFKYFYVEWQKHWLKCSKNVKKKSEFHDKHFDIISITVVKRSL